MIRINDIALIVIIGLLVAMVIFIGLVVLGQALAQARVLLKLAEMQQRQQGFEYGLLRGSAPWPTTDIEFKSGRAQGLMIRNRIIAEAQMQKVAQFGLDPLGRTSIDPLR